MGMEARRTERSGVKRTTGEVTQRVLGTRGVPSSALTALASPYRGPLALEEGAEEASRQPVRLRLRRLLPRDLPHVLPEGVADAIVGDDGVLDARLYVQVKALSLG